MNSEVAKIIKCAELLGMTEHDLFCKAAIEWGKTEYIAHQDFVEYIIYEKIPFYVRSYIREHC